MVDLYPLAGITAALAAMLAAVWWLQRRTAAMAPPDPFTRKRQIVLTPQHRLHVVRFGSRELLVATHPGGTSLLDRRRAARDGVSRPVREGPVGGGPVREGPVREGLTGTAGAATPGAQSGGQSGAGAGRSLRQVFAPLRPRMATMEPSADPARGPSPASGRPERFARGRSFPPPVIPIAGPMAGPQYGDPLARGRFRVHSAVAHTQDGSAWPASLAEDSLVAERCKPGEVQS